LYDDGFRRHGALLIDLANSSTTVEKVLHYPRPGPSVIEQTFTTTNPQPRDLRDAPRIKKEEVPARDQPEKNINDSRVLFAKADTAKRKLEIKDKPLRLAHKPKVPAPQRERGLAPQREKYEGGHGYAMSVGQGPGYHPGLDGFTT
jgi:hypothetical protein